MSKQSKFGPGRVIVEGSRPHTIRHTKKTHPVGLLYTSDQPLTDTATYTTHNKHQKISSMPSAGFEPRDPSNQTDTDRRLTLLEPELFLLILAHPVHKM